MCVMATIWSTQNIDMIFSVELLVQKLVSILGFLESFLVYRNCRAQREGGMKDFCICNL